MTPVTRLAGFSFDRVAEPAADALSRMDVALFVGFAASGPIGVPVAVEEAAEFEAVFGADVPIAWDAQRGVTISGHLAPTVRSFFRNGGRRCWIVRVAGAGASPNVFPLAGLVSASAGGSGWTIAPALAMARSEGSWSDAFEIAAVVDRQPVIVTAVTRAGAGLLADVASARQLAVGDVIRLAFGPLYAFGVIRSIASPQQAPSQLALDPVLWFRELDRAPVGPGTASFPARADATVVRRASIPAVPAWQPGALLAVDVDLESGDDIRPGTILRCSFDRELFMNVSTVSIADSTAPLRRRVEGTALTPIDGASASAAATSLPRLDAADRLALTLLARRQGSRASQQIPQLGLASTHPIFWGSIADDATFYRPLAEPSGAVLSGRERLETFSRFPTAGSAHMVAITVPLGDVLVPNYLPALGSTASPAERDGLAAFSAAPFLDDRLLDANVNDLMGRAEFIRYRNAPMPRSLRGIHAALFLDEPTLVAVPDAVHRRWTLDDETRVGLLSPPTLPVDPPAVVECPPASGFHPCAPCVLDAPALDAHHGAGRITLSWTLAKNPLEGSVDAFVLQESVGPDFPAWADVWSGTHHEFDVYDRPPGVYAYRVIARRGALTSPPSMTAIVTLAAGRRAVVAPAEEYDDVTMLDLHRALVRFAAARGDITAVLGLPSHYRESESIAYVRTLVPGGASLRRGSVPELSVGEEPALTYGAVYHPWLITTEPDAISPPDGAACGVLARRALERGAWVAPANEPLQGVVALTPALDETRRLDLLIGRINVIRQEPRGFVSLSADTLSSDDELRPLSVRRLLILLRRQALQVGAQYVFEPNGDAFRRMIQRGFDEMLGHLHARGAFAGRTASSAFQVVTSTAINTPQQQDLGRFFVELRVAPSRPLTFLTIRLMQRGDRLTAGEVG